MTCIILFVRRRKITIRHSASKAFKTVNKSEYRVRFINSCTSAKKPFQFSLLVSMKQELEALALLNLCTLHVDVCLLEEEKLHSKASFHYTPSLFFSSCTMHYHIFIPLVHLALLLLLSLITEIQECASMPCQNGGQCIDEINGFRCICEEGWTGVTCEIG